MGLTEYQINVATEVAGHLCSGVNVFLKGDSGSGKSTIVAETAARLSQQGKSIAYFDLLEMADLANGCISGQTARSYLRTLSNNVNVVVIEDINSIETVVCDWYTKLRNFFVYILERHMKTSNTLFLLTGSCCSISKSQYFQVDLRKTDNDVIFKQYGLSDTVISVFPNISIDVGIKASLAKEPIKEIMRLTGQMTSEDNIDEPTLFGCKDILAKLNTHIVTPIRKGKTPKKGLVLAGPSGTGKTSMAKWLACQLGGKFFSISPSPTIVSDLQKKISEAYTCAPAVVFIDDVDGLFDNEDTTRGFLTILDGVESKKRKSIIVVVACMDSHSIPSAMVRGGRLEMLLHTSLPDYDTRIDILRKHCDGLNYEYWSHQMDGWNCADVTRAAADAIREQESTEMPLETVMGNIITSIRQQYECVTKQYSSHPKEHYSYYS